MISEEQENADFEAGRKKSEAEFIEMMELCLDEGWSPTKCPSGCLVEPDGICPHEYQSIALEDGLV